MPKGWWILPSVVCGSAMWLYGGWATYQAVRGDPADPPVVVTLASSERASRDRISQVD